MGIIDSGITISYKYDAFLLWGRGPASLLQKIAYWETRHKEDAKTDKKVRKTYYKEGKWWNYGTPEQWQKQLPSYSSEAIKKFFSILRKDGVIIAKNFNPNRYDKTLWYAIDHDRVAELEKELRSKEEKEIEQDIIDDEKDVTEAEFTLSIR